MPLTGQSALADASYMVSAPAKALIHSSVSDQNWKNCQLLRRRMAGFSAAVDIQRDLTRARARHMRRSRDMAGMARGVQYVGEKASLRIVDQRIAHVP